MWNMRKIFNALVWVFALSLFVTSCSEDDPIDEDITFDQTLLHGRWQDQGKKTEFWVFTSDKKGYTWDTSEGVTEEDAKKPGDEGQTFTWELTANNLIEAHFGGKTQRSYVILELTKDKMRRKSTNAKDEKTYKKIGN